MNVGVHETHCCAKHGCKYSDEDCPVYKGDIAPRYPRNNGCEQCEMEVEERHATVSVFTLACAIFESECGILPNYMTFQMKAWEERIKKAKQILATIDRLENNT